MTLFRPDLVYPRGATFRQCIGLVFWWLGLYFAVMCVLFGVAATLPIFIFGNSAQGFEILGKCCAGGAIWWILGRAFLNLFSAR
jgi:hypothetical protein